jgi:hypothetical protein
MRFDVLTRWNGIVSVNTKRASVLRFRVRLWLEIGSAPRPDLFPLNGKTAYVFTKAEDQAGERVQVASGETTLTKFVLQHFQDVLHLGGGAASSERDPRRCALRGLGFILW